MVSQIILLPSSSLLLILQYDYIQRHFPNKSGYLMYQQNNLAKQVLNFAILLTFAFFAWSLLSSVIQNPKNNVVTDTAKTISSLTRSEEDVKYMDNFNDNVKNAIVAEALDNPTFTGFGSKEGELDIFTIIEKDFVHDFCPQWALVSENTITATFHTLCLVTITGDWKQFTIDSAITPNDTVTNSSSVKNKTVYSLNSTGQYITK